MVAKISACLVVRNEGKTISRCLENICCVVDEIVVVHDGKCTDDTLQVCKKFCARVFVKPFVGFCGYYRQESVSLAHNDWVLVIDADELLSDSLKKALPLLVNQKRFVAFSILFEHYFLDKKILGHVLGSDYHSRLFRKSKCAYNNNVWDVLLVSGRTKKIDFPILHKPLYDNYSFQQLFSKHLKRARVHALYGTKDSPRIFFLLSALIHFFRKLVYYWILKLGFLDGFVGLKVGFVVAFHHLAMNYYKFKYYDSSAKKN